MLTFGKFAFGWLDAGFTAALVLGGAVLALRDCAYRIEHPSPPIHAGQFCGYSGGKAHHWAREGDAFSGSDLSCEPDGDF